MANKIVSADGHMDLFYPPADTFSSRAPPRRVGNHVGVCDNGANRRRV